MDSLDARVAQVNIRSECSNNLGDSEALSVIKILIV